MDISDLSRKHEKKEDFVLTTASGEQVVVKAKQRKKYSKATYAFIIAMIALPLLNWLIFYVYLNIDSFFLSFFRYRGSGKNMETYFTFENYSMVFKDLASGTSELNESFKNTFLTFGVNLIVWPFQIALSYFLYKKIRLANVFRVLFYIPSIICGIVVANFVTALGGFYGPLRGVVAKWWHLPKEEVLSIFTDSRFANFFVLLEMVWIGFPGNLILWGGTLARIPDSLIEYGQLEGIGWVKEIYMIIIPLIWPTFILLFIMMWAGLFNSSGSVFLLTGGGYGTQTLSNWMYMQVYGVQTKKSNNYNFMAAFGLLLSIVASAISLTTRYLASKVNTEVEY